MVEYKFKIGDKVKIVKSGYGCNPLALNTIVKITKLGNYDGRNGYQIDNNQIQTNTKTGDHKGFIGESSFELVKEDKQQKFNENDIVVCIPQPLPNPGDKGPRDIPGGAGYKPNLCFRVTLTDRNSVAWNNNTGVYFNSLRHATEEEKQKYYDLKKPYITTEEIFEEKLSRFNIGDIVDTNELGWQYTNMKVLSKIKNYDKKGIFVDCNCKTKVLKNVKILDITYSPYTECWWYQLEGFGNWYSEHSLVAKEKENEKVVEKVPVIQNKKIEILREPVLNKRQKKIKKINKINKINLIIK